MGIVIYVFLFFVSTVEACKKSCFNFFRFKFFSFTVLFRFVNFFKNFFHIYLQIKNNINFFLFIILNIIFLNFFYFSAFVCFVSSVIHNKSFVFLKRPSLFLIFVCLHPNFKLRISLRNKIGL